eukprot:1860408-Rhodomonas_salina.1
MAVLTVVTIERLSLHHQWPGPRGAGGKQPPAGAQPQGHVPPSRASSRTPRRLASIHSHSPRPLTSASDVSVANLL